MMREELEGLTTEQLTAGFSDCYKSLYHVRPSPECLIRPYLINFWVGYDARLNQQIDRDRKKLAASGFDSWDAYYDNLEAANRFQIEEWRRQRVETEAYRQCYLTKGHPLPVIENWEHGGKR